MGKDVRSVRLQEQRGQGWRWILAGVEPETAIRGKVLLRDPPTEGMIRWNHLLFYRRHYHDTGDSVKKSIGTGKIPYYGGGRPKGEVQKTGL